MRKKIGYIYIYIRLNSKKEKQNTFGSVEKLRYLLTVHFFFLNSSSFGEKKKKNFLVLLNFQGYCIVWLLIYYIYTIILRKVKEALQQ